jgi:hypothetical protein
MKRDGAAATAGAGEAAGDGTDRTAGEPLLATHDLERARDIITRIYIPHDLQTRDGRPLNFQLRRTSRRTGSPWATASTGRTPSCWSHP